MIVKQNPYPDDDPTRAEVRLAWEEGYEAARLELREPVDDLCRAVDNVANLTVYDRVVGHCLVCGFPIHTAFGACAKGCTNIGEQ